MGIITSVGDGREAISTCASVDGLQCRWYGCSKRRVKVTSRETASDWRSMYCLNVWLTVKDNSNIETVRSLLSEQVKLSRAEPGCLRFEVYHSQADPRR